MAQVNLKKEAKFVLHAPRDAMFQFRAIYNDAKGEVRKLLVSKQGDKEIYVTFKWPAGKRTISFPANKKDILGTSYVDFLINHPMCTGSPACDADQGAFFEFDPKRDAGIALDEKKERLKAENMAMDLKGEALKNMAAYIGCFDEDSEVQMNAVSDYARTAPKDFLKAAESPDMSYVGLFNIAFNEGVILKKGFLYTFENETIGNTEAKAIESLGRKEGLAAAVKEKLKNKK
jgi:hypothetical protein